MRSLRNLMVYQGLAKRGVWGGDSSWIFFTHNELELSLSVASQVTYGYSHFKYRKKGFHHHNRQPLALFSYLSSLCFWWVFPFQKRYSNILYWASYLERLFLLFLFYRIFLLRETFFAPKLEGFFGSQNLCAH